MAVVGLGVAIDDDVIVIVVAVVNVVKLCCNCDNSNCNGSCCAINNAESNLCVHTSIVPSKTIPA